MFCRRSCNHIKKKDFYQTFYSKIVNFNLQKNYEKELIDSINLLFWVENHNKQINFNNNGLIIVDNIIENSYLFKKNIKTKMVNII
ncbi:hypothetical protein PSOL_06730 [Candidatus Phytoplasma solani]|uniref:hypothetical protein n=1 Tax=Candidatus Phytoplasma solani TaxID=69896 RepID=UPI0032DBDC22